VNAVISKRAMQESDLLAFHIAISIAIAVQWALVQIAHLVD
jgi:hypothetical protein